MNCIASSAMTTRRRNCIAATAVAGLFRMVQKRDAVVPAVEAAELSVERVLQEVKRLRRVS